MYQQGVAIFLPMDWVRKNGQLDVFFPPHFNSGAAGVDNAGSLFSACFSDRRPNSLWQKVISDFEISKFVIRNAWAEWDCCDSRWTPGECAYGEIVQNEK